MPNLQLERQFRQVQTAISPIGGVGSPTYGAYGRGGYHSRLDKAFFPPVQTNFINFIHDTAHFAFAVLAVPSAKE